MKWNAFAKEGAKVVITDRLEDRAKEAAEQLKKMLSSHWFKM